MELTPIRIRGKRRRPGEPKLPDLRALKRKERMERASTEPRAKKRRRRPQSLEEKLPLEVLERIFLLSENLDFARSSARIGFLLSNRNLLVELLVAAFGPTWDNWFGCVSSDVVSYRGYYTQDVTRFGGNPKFQTAVLDCPWAKLPLILDAQHLWFRRHGRDRHYRHLVDVDSRICRNDPAHPHGSEGFSHVQSIRRCFEAEQSVFAHATTMLELSRYGAGRNRRTHMDVHPQTRIPDILLSGPFNREMCDRLFWLMKGGARLSAEETWEVTKEGFENILLLKDDGLMTELLHIFDVLGVFRVQWPAHILGEALEKVSMMLRDDLGYRDFQAFSFLANVSRFIPLGERSSSVNSLAQWYGDVEDTDIEGGFNQS